MSMKPILLSFAILLLIVGCTPQADIDQQKQEAHARKVKRSDVQGEFRSKLYPVSEFEHVAVFDMPDRYTPLRCWAFVNEKTNTSNMRCDDEGAADLPDIGPTLEK